MKTLSPFLCRGETNLTWATWHIHICSYILKFSVGLLKAFCGILLLGNLDLVLVLNTSILPQSSQHLNFSILDWVNNVKAGSNKFRGVYWINIFGSCYHELLRFHRAWDGDTDINSLPFFFFRSRHLNLFGNLSSGYIRKSGKLASPI